MGRNEIIRHAIFTRLLHRTHIFKCGYVNMCGLLQDVWHSDRVKREFTCKHERMLLVKHVKLNTF